MKKKLFYHELKKFLSIRTLVTIVLLTILPLVVQFCLIKEGYVYYKTLEMFEDGISGIFSLVFPLVVMLYSYSYSTECKKNFIISIQARINLKEYLVNKGIFIVVVSFFVYFVIVSCNFCFYNAIVPKFNLIKMYSTKGAFMPGDDTLTVLLQFGLWGYGFIYAVWIAMNAALYSVMAYLFTLNIKNNIVAMAIPIFIYHVGNFVMAVLGKAQYSPVISIFPYSITKVPLYCLLVPFFCLIIVIIILVIRTMRCYEKGGLVNGEK